MSTGALIGLVIFGVTLLLGLIAVVRLHAFLALLVTSLVVAVLGGIPLAEIAEVIQHEMGGTLGYIAVVIGVAIAIIRRVTPVLPEARGVVNYTTPMTERERILLTPSHPSNTWTNPPP